MIHSKIFKTNPSLFFVPVSLENVAGDVCELERGMEAVRKEAEARDGLRASPHVLRDFLANAADKLRRLRAETKHAQVFISVFYLDLLSSFNNPVIDVFLNNWIIEVGHPLVNWPANFLSSDCP